MRHFLILFAILTSLATAAPAQSRGTLNLKLEKISLERALDLLSRRTGLRFDTDGLEIDKVVSLDAKDASVGQALSQLGLAMDPDVEQWRYERDTGRVALVTLDRVEVIRKRWPLQAHDDRLSVFGRLHAGKDPEGKVVGRVLETRLFFGRGQGDWRVTKAREGERELEIGTCKKHSPKKVLLRSAATGSVGIELEVRSWTFRDRTVVMRHPKAEQTRTVSPFTLRVDWPYVVLESSADYPPEVLEEILLPTRISWKRRPSAVAKEGGIGLGGGAGGSFTGGRRSSKATDWCGCRRCPGAWEPAPGVKGPIRRLVDLDATDYDITDVEQIRIILAMPRLEERTIKLEEQ